MRALLLIALALAGDLGTVDDADAPTVGVSIDKSEAHVGDRLTLTISAVARAGIAVMLPPKLDTGKLEILDRNDGDKSGRDLGDGRRSHRFVLGVAAYETGELEIPPLEVTYLLPSGQVHSVQTEPLTVNVRPLVAPDEQHPEAQPERPPRSAWVEDQRVVRAMKWGGLGLGGAIVLLVAGLLVRRAWRRRVPAATVAGSGVPKRAPDAVAIEKLTALRSAGGFAVDGYRPFYFALTEIVREYLGARYGFDALEMTTTEVLDELGRRAEHLVSEDAEVPRFLRACDLVKFAKAGSTDAGALDALEAAQAIVLSTAAPLETVAQSISGPVRLPIGPTGVPGVAERSEKKGTTGG
jgi:hypothetical protein